MQNKEIVRLPARAATSQRDLAEDSFVTEYDVLSINTTEAPQFLDLTSAVEDFVQRSQIHLGTINVQVRHTTIALLINENERLLLQDFERQLESTASAQGLYQHDQLSLRTGITLQERQNGHAHCKAMSLRSSETINIVHCRLDLGRWQRLFVVELDTASARTLSMVAMGMRRNSHP